MIKDLFKEVHELTDMMNSNLLEVSVKQHQIDVLFKQDDTIFFKDLKEIYLRINKSHKIDEPYIITFENEVHFVIPFSESVEEKDSYIFMKVIKKISEEICQCPSLEFVVSPHYVKCFLDKPGLYVEDLEKYNQILQGKGTLELHTQRPYLLYIYYDNEQNSD